MREARSKALLRTAVHTLHEPDTCNDQTRARWVCEGDQNAPVGLVELADLEDIETIGFHSTGRHFSKLGLHVNKRLRGLVELLDGGDCVEVVLTQMIRVQVFHPFLRLEKGGTSKYNEGNVRRGTMTNTHTKRGPGSRPC